MTGWKDKLTGPLARNAAIALYVICVAGLIMAYMSVSLRHVDYAAYMRAEPTAAPGGPVAMRGRVLDAHRGVPLRRGEVRFRLVEASSEDASSGITESKGVDWTRAQIQPNGFFHLRAPLPDAIAAGDYKLVMHTHLEPKDAGSDGGESFVTDAPFRVLGPLAAADYWPEPTERRIADKNEASGGVKSSEGPIQVDVWPADGQVARGLESRVYIRTSRRDDGEPVSARLHLTQTHGINEAKIPATIQTDGLGLVSVPTQAATDLTWTLSTEEPMRLDVGDVKAPSEPARADEKKDEMDGREDEPSSEVSHAKLVLSTVPSQVSLRMNDPLAVAGGTADGSVDSLFHDGGLMVDLYKADRWVDAKVFGISAKGGGIRVDIPKKSPALESDLEDASRPIDLYRVQVYRSIYGVENAWDIDYLIGAPNNELADYQHAARALAEHIAAHIEDPYFDQILKTEVFELSTSKNELRTWISAMTQVLPRHLDVQPPLINSREASIAKLDAETAEIQKKLKLLTTIALLIGLAFLGYLVLLGIGGYREQGRLLQDVDIEMACESASDISDTSQVESGEEAELSRNIQRENLTFGVLIFIVAGTLSLFVLGLLMLLSYF